MTIEFRDGLRAAKAVSTAITKGWETVASLETAMDWAGDAVPETVTHEWYRAFHVGLKAQGYGHLFRKMHESV